MGFQVAQLSFSAKVIEIESYFLHDFGYIAMFVSRFVRFT